jgi:hypothetical protein
MYNLELESSGKGCTLEKQPATAAGQRQSIARAPAWRLASPAPAREEASSRQELAERITVEF